jgi:hypothetical protein
MAEARETSVFYKAVVDYANLKRELRNVRNELAKTKAAEQAYNASSQKERSASTRAANTRAKALRSESASLKLVLANLTKYRDRQKSVTTAVVAANVAIKAQNTSLLTNAKRLTAAALAAKDYASAQRSISKATGVSSDSIRTQKELAKAQAATTKTTRQQTEALKENADSSELATHRSYKLVEGLGWVDQKTGEVQRRLEDFDRSNGKSYKGFNRFHKALVRFRSEADKLNPTVARIERGSNRLYKSLERFGNWRPRLIPPFVALIPIIGAVIAALNPLVALLGSVGAVAIGLAGQIGSLAGAFVALPGILAAVVAGIGSVIASMGGVGNVFKTYSAMQKALGKSSGSGETQAERAEKVADAERSLAKAQKNVTKAQEALNKAREEALQDLIDLRLEVSRASLNEERAIASLQQARDNYNNVMADPGSQLGDKLDAAARIKEAEADLEDVRKQNIKNQNDLVAAEKKGVNQSDKVVDAQENLADAYEAQSDAQRALNTEAKGGSAAVEAVNAYNEALAALSPSARKFVLALIGMQDQWKAFRQDMQETFFSQFTDDLDRLPRLLDTISRFLKPAAKAMGEFVDKFLDMMDSPAWKSDLESIGESNYTVISNLGDAFLSLSSFLKDVVVAAEPFTEWLTGGLADGAENLSKLLDTDEERGSFREWLEKVEDRLKRWWEIVKNVGKTIYGFSAAASEFGDWITDGLLEMTGNWAKAAEEANTPGSEFKGWLDRIKPVLEEVDRLLGSFFGWLGEEAMDQENIDSAVALLQILTDDVGPKLATLFDTLSKTDIDEKFFKALGSIIESVNTLMENGGSTAFETFFTVIEDFFSGLSIAVGAIPKPILDGLLTLLGIIAGATFIGKFTGLTNALGKLPVFIENSKKLYGWFAALDALKFLSLLKVLGFLAMGIEGANTSTANNDFFRTFTSLTASGDFGGATDAANKDGAAIKALTGPSFLNPMGLANLGAVSDIVGLVFGEDAKSNFDGFLESLTSSLTDWAEDDFAPALNIALVNMTENWDNFWQNIMPTVASTGWTNFQTGWNTFWSNFKLGWDTGWASLSSGFTSIVSGLTATWAQIQNAFRGPANWVISNVWNSGIRKFWNDTAGKLGLGTLPEASLIPEARIAAPVANRGQVKYFAEGGVLPGYTPGRDVHTFRSNTGGTLKLSGGEAIMRPEFTKLMGGKDGIDQINKAARYGHFANGGVIGDWAVPPSKRGGVKKKADVGGDLFSQIGGALSRLFSDPVGYVGDGLKSLVAPLLSGMGDSGWSGVMKAIPGKLIDGMVSSVKSWFTANPSGGGGGANALGWQKQWSIIHNAFPKATLNSAYRPGAKTINGGVSYHSSGRAIDVTPSMEIFNWIRQNYPNSRELIYSPAGGRQLQNGKNYFWGEPVRSQHWSHVHWAMKNGGVFDNGGWMQPGQAGFNFSNKPEAVLTNEESLGLKKLLAGTGLSGARPAFGASAATAISSAPQIVDNSINIETVVMNNPVPEKPSDSLPKAIRRIGYMNQARTGPNS